MLICNLMWRQMTSYDVIGLYSYWTLPSCQVLKNLLWKRKSTLRNLLEKNCKNGKVNYGNSVKYHICCNLTTRTLFVFSLEFFLKWEEKYEYISLPDCTQKLYTYRIWIFFFFVCGYVCVFWTLIWSSSLKQNRYIKFMEDSRRF